MQASWDMLLRLPLGLSSVMWVLLSLLQPYMCLRYVRTRVPTTKSDVYSFGVVLLEIATGWPAMANGQHILEKVCHLHLKHASRCTMARRALRCIAAHYGVACVVVHHIRRHHDEAS